ncbi:MAG: CheB methylesterase domain-containing protein [bacterium]
MINKWAVVIGSSTGGTKILELILQEFPKDFAADIFIVQHIPPQFIVRLAERLNKLCHIEIKPGEAGETVQKGVAYIAPGDCHLQVEKSTTNYYEKKIQLICEAYKFGICPAIDITMKSIAATYRQYSIGVILSGMGEDGLEGMQAIKAVGGICLVQDPVDAVIRSMPEAIIKAGIADQLLERNLIGKRILEIITNGSK